MSYIGNAGTLLIFGPNTTEDIIPDGASSTFTLTQSVPGSYESNVVVVRKRYYTKTILTGNDHIQVDPNNEKLIVTDEETAAALSQLSSPVANSFLIQRIRLFNFPDLAGAGGNPQDNNDIAFRIPAGGIVYDGLSIEITVDANLYTDDNTIKSYTGIDLQSEFEGPWEVLEPENDYTISGENDNLITFSDTPTIDDQIYVVHRGEATHNFVPTEKSVGPEQLQENLRNFIIDRYDVSSGGVTDFALSQEAISPNSLIVTVDGEVKDGSNPSESFVGEWQLSVDGLTVEFLAAVPNPSKVRIHHLGFSTVSRRAVFVPGQPPTIVAPGTIGTSELANNSVTSAKLSNVPPAVQAIHIEDDAVGSTKVLLSNDEALRAEQVSTTPFDVIKIDSSDNTVIDSPGELKIGSTTTAVSPEGTTSLGTVTEKFTDLHLSANANIDSDVNVGGNIIGSGTVSVSGDISGSGTYNSIDLVALEAQVAALQATVDAGIIIPGTISVYAGENLPSGWLFCDGSVVSQATYPNLYANIQDRYNTGSEPAGTFRLPDARQRFIIGILDPTDPDGLLNIGQTASVLGEKGGEIDHDHVIPNHRHKMIHDHDLPPHYHDVDSGAGSDLTILSSGSHTTSLNHDHPSFNTNGLDGVHTHDVTTATSLYSDNNFGGRNSAHINTINLTTSEDATVHTHEYDTDTDVDGAHQHSVNIVDFDNAVSGNTNFVKAGGPSTVSTIPLGSPDGNHEHNLSGTTTQQNTNHSHTINGSTNVSGGHQHTVRGTVPSDSSEHVHQVDVPGFTGDSSSTGDHVHATSSFIGGIGDKNSGNDGNTTLLTQTTNTATVDIIDSDPVTDYIADGGPGNTGTENPPYITMNYIIKI